jgi:LCP family protein required for cell wall assembly
MPLHGDRQPADDDRRLDELAKMHRPRRWPRRILILANVCVFAVIALIASGYAYVDWQAGRVTRLSVAHLISPGHSVQSSKAAPGASNAGPPETFLLVGSDTRSLGAGSNAAFGNTATVQGQRSDSVILARVVPATASIALLSIPRDLVVPIPGMGTQRINAAFNSGNPSLLIQTIEQNFGIDINHYLEANFATFEQLADAIGGVEVWFPAPAKDVNSDFGAVKGCVNLKGAEALAFVRSREYEYQIDGVWHYQYVPESDLARIQRQQAFIKLAIKKAESLAPTNPIALDELISSVTKNLTVDSSFSTSDMIRLATTMRHANPSAIPNWTYPTANIPGTGELQGVGAADQQMVQQFLNYGEPKSSTSSTSSAPSTTVPSIAASSITVDVLNGSGVGGQASAAASALRSAGFNVGTIGDATSFGQQTTLIQYGSGGLSAAQKLQSEIGGGATLQSSASVSGDTVILVTGNSYSGIGGSGSEASGSGGSGSGASGSGGSGSGGSASTTPSTSSAPTSSTTVPLSQVPADSSTYYNGHYIPPGLQPGEIPQTCGN